MRDVFYPFLLEWGFVLTIVAGTLSLILGAWLIPASKDWKASNERAAREKQESAQQEKLHSELRLAREETSEARQEVTRLSSRLADSFDRIDLELRVFLEDSKLGEEEMRQLSPGGPVSFADLLVGAEMYAYSADSSDPCVSERRLSGLNELADLRYGEYGDVKWDGADIVAYAGLRQRDLVRYKGIYLPPNSFAEMRVKHRTGDIATVEELRGSCVLISLRWIVAGEWDGRVDPTLWTPMPQYKFAGIEGRLRLNSRMLSISSGMPVRSHHQYSVFRLKID